MFLLLLLLPDDGQDSPIECTVCYGSITCNRLCYRTVPNFVHRRSKKRGFFFYRRDRASLNYSISILLVWRKMLTSFMYRLIWTGSSEFGSYHLCEQRRFGRSCASPESQLLAQTSNESRGTFRQKARSLAPLNDWAWAVKIFHDQECSKTQIRLTRPIFLR